VTLPSSVDIRPRATSSAVSPARDIELSVVVPAYNEAGNIDALVERLDAVLAGMGVSYEIIIVDDGSADATWSELNSASRRNPRIVGISLSRNFGHQGALLAGLSRASGQAIISMDADLQHPPSVIPQLVDAWRAGAQVVRTLRHDAGITSGFKRLTSRWFYRAFSFLTDIPMAAGMSDFRLLDRRVLDELLRLRNRDLFLRGSVEWLGYRSATIEFDVDRRHSGESKYTFSRMLRFAAGAVISFSPKPLKLGIWLGLWTSLLALVEIVYAVVQYLRGNTVPGWASLTAVMSFLFGVLFIVLGIIGAYIARIHDILQNRPPFVIAESTEHRDRAS
jgi:dolichol-phosphate mannosyltransferase